MNLTSRSCHVCCVEVRKQFDQGVVVLLWCVREEVLHTVGDLVDWKERQRVDHTAEVFDVCRDSIVPGGGKNFTLAIGLLARYNYNSLLIFSTLFTFQLYSMR